MEDQTVQAIYERGTLRLLEPLDASLTDGQQVFVTVKSELSPAEMTDLAASVYAGMTEEEIAEVERLALDRSHFFTERASA